MCVLSLSQISYLCPSAGWQDGHHQHQTPLRHPHPLAAARAMWPLAGALGGALWPPPPSPEVRGRLPASLLGTDPALQHVSPQILPQLRDLDPLTPSSLEVFSPFREDVSSGREDRRCPGSRKSCAWWGWRRWGLCRRSRKVQVKEGRSRCTQMLAATRNPVLALPTEYGTITKGLEAGLFHFPSPDVTQLM